MHNEFTRHCEKCWNTAEHTRLYSVILVEEGGHSKWINLCENHFYAFKSWLVNGTKQLPRQVDGLQQSLVNY